MALLANASELEIIHYGILDGFLFADYIICMSTSEAGDMQLSVPVRTPDSLLDFEKSLQVRRINLASSLSR